MLSAPPPAGADHGKGDTIGRLEPAVLTPAVPGQHVAPDAGAGERGCGRQKRASRDAAMQECWTSSHDEPPGKTVNDQL